MKNSKLRVGVLGAGRWAELAHIPGWQRDPRCEVVVLCDPLKARAEDLAGHFRIPEATHDWMAVVARDDLDVIDVCTPSATHFGLRGLPWKPAGTSCARNRWPTISATHCERPILPSPRG